MVRAALSLIVFFAACSTALAGGESLSFDPPARYAGEYKGELTIERLPPKRAIARCLELGAPRAPKYGCASPGGSWCHVVIPDRIVHRPHNNYMTPEAVLRHELGHCNGWPSDHPDE